MKIIIAEPLATNIKEKINKLEQQNHQIIAFDTRPISQDDLLQRIQGADIAVIANYPVSKQVINKTENLQLLMIAFTGTDHIAVNACKDRGITVCNAAGYSTQAVAELTVGLIIAAMRGFTINEQRCRAQKSREGFLGKEIQNKTIGIIGAGAISSRVMELLMPFNCNIICYSRTEKKFNHVSFVSKTELLKKSDIITLHIPATADTENFIDTREIELIQTGAYLINTARGIVLNSKALATALNSGKLSGAATDVFETEPPIDDKHPLLNAPNITVLPHIAYATHEAMVLRAEIVFNTINNWLNKQPLHNQIA